MKFPTEWKNKSHVANHQPVSSISCKIICQESDDEVLGHESQFVGIKNGYQTNAPFDARKIGPHRPCMDVYLVFITAAIFILIQIVKNFTTLDQKTNHIIKEKNTYNIQVYLQMIIRHRNPSFVG